MILARKNAFQEDVSQLAAGSNIITDQCAVYAITISKEGDTDAIVSISDSNGYDVNERVEKAVLTAEIHTVQLVYPGGKLFTTGFSATANTASVDIAVTYE